MGFLFHIIPKRQIAQRKFYNDHRINYLSGSPEEIGCQHGQLLAEQIHRNIDFYKSIFLKSFGNESQILSAARHFKESIHAYNPNYVLEIDNIALGAAISEPLWLYAINSRTELSMLNGVHECTAIVCPKKGLLAQTWDWAQNFLRISIYKNQYFGGFVQPEAGHVGSRFLRVSQKGN